MDQTDSIYDTLRGILGDGADEKINSVLGALSSGQSEQKPVVPSINPQNMEYLMKLRTVLDEIENVGDDNRSRLLVSLKPYMRGTRQKSIDSAIKLLNLTKLSGLFK